MDYAAVIQAERERLTAQIEAIQQQMEMLRNALNQHVGALEELGVLAGKLLPLPDDAKEVAAE